MSDLPPLGEGNRRLVRHVRLPPIGTYVRGMMEYEWDKVGVVVAHHQRVEDVCGMGDSSGPVEPLTGPGVTVRVLLDHDRDSTVDRDSTEELVFHHTQLRTPSDRDLALLNAPQPDEIG